MTQAQSDDLKETILIQPLTEPESCDRFQMASDRCSRLGGLRVRAIIELHDVCFLNDMPSSIVSHAQASI